MSIVIIYWEDTRLIWVLVEFVVRLYPVGAEIWENSNSPMSRNAFSLRRPGKLAFDALVKNIYIYSFWKNGHCSALANVETPNNYWYNFLINLVKKTAPEFNVYLYFVISFIFFHFNLQLLDGITTIYYYWKKAFKDASKYSLAQTCLIRYAYPKGLGKRHMSQLLTQLQI